jgi:hypothetical protein
MTGSPCAQARGTTGRSASGTGANLWPNRMIGDLQPAVTKRYTFTDYKPYQPDSPLLESGLLGPVRLSAITR